MKDLQKDLHKKLLLIMFYFKILAQKHRSSITIPTQNAGEEVEGNSQVYETIVAAHDVLRNPFMRALYDCCGADAVASAETVRYVYGHLHQRAVPENAM